MKPVEQPSPAPVTPAVPSTPPVQVKPIRNPRISLILGILSIVFILVPFLGLGLGIAATIVGFRSAFKEGATPVTWVGTVLGLGGAMIGLCIVLAALLFGISIVQFS